MFQQLMMAVQTLVMRLRLSFTKAPVAIVVYDEREWKWDQMPPFGFKRVGDAIAYAFDEYGSPTILKWGWIPRFQKNWKIVRLKVIPKPKPPVRRKRSWG